MHRGLFALVVALTLAGCATEPDHYDRPGTTQAQFQQDFAGCRLAAMNVPQVHTPQQPVYTGGSTTYVTGQATTNYYGGAANTYGNATAVTTPTPNTGAEMANGISALGDALVNVARERQALHLCMQAHGYTLRAKT